MLKNVLKIVFLGIVGFSVLVYLTAPKDRLQGKNEDSSITLNTALLPSHFELIGDSFYTKKVELFNEKEESFLIVLNHDSLAVFDELYKFTDKKIILVANVSKTPWLIKKLAVTGKLEDLYKNSKIKIVNDADGKVANALRLNDIGQTKYFIYKVEKTGNISKIFEGNVKFDALQKGILTEEKETILNSVIDKLK